MTTKTYRYLEEGFLEAYLTGLTSEEERSEVKQCLNESPDLQDELEELETDMEQFFMRHAVPPPPSVRDAVMSRIGDGEIQKWQPGFDNRQQTYRRENEPDYRGAQYVNVEVDNTHIRVHKYWRPAFIAVFVLSKIFLIAGLYYYFKADSLEREMQRMQQQSIQQPTAPKLKNTP